MNPVFNLEQTALLGILSAVGHWLVARAEITRPLWSRARGVADKLLRCPSCSGFWLGLALGAAGLRPVTLATNTYGVGEALISGALAVFLTPVFEATLLWGLEQSAVPADEPTADTPPPQPPA